MKKRHLLAMTAFVVFLFNIVYVAPGFATEILWLNSGNPIATPQFDESNGEITIGNLKTALGEAAVLCSVFFDSTVGPGGKDEVSEVLNLSGQDIALGARELLCVNVKNCPSPRVVAFNLPWVTKLELMGTEAQPLFLDLYSTTTGGPGWEIDCTQPVIGLE
jgi:hypothetical protein